MTDLAARALRQPYVSGRKLIRTAQTHFPSLVEFKFGLQRAMRAGLRKPSHSIYRFFQRFPFAPGQQFLDIGANRGQTIDSFRLFRKDVSLVAFEPNPRLASRLVAIYGSDPLIKVERFGLSDQNGAFTLHVPAYRGFVFDGLASFDRQAAANWLSRETIFFFNPQLITVDTIECQVGRLDDFVTNPGLIKIDVQGLEERVLLGAQQTIARSRPTFIIENDEDPDNGHAAHLKKADYRSAEFTQGQLNMDKMGFRDTIYVPAEKAEIVIAAYRN